MLHIIAQIMRGIIISTFFIIDWALHNLQVLNAKICEWLVDGNGVNVDMDFVSPNEWFEEIFK